MAGKRQPESPKEKTGSRSKARKVQGRGHRYRSRDVVNRLTRLTKQYMKEVTKIYDRIFEMRNGDWKWVNIGQSRLKDELGGKIFDDYVGKYNFMQQLKAKAMKELRSIGCDTPKDPKKARSTAAADTSLYSYQVNN